MPKIASELEAIEVKRLTRPGFHAVGGVTGLLLRVSKTGARSWVLRVMVGGKRSDIGLGGFPDCTLSQARARAREEKDKIRRGVNPIEERRKRRAQQRIEAENRKTFAEVWQLFQSAKLVGITQKTRQHWINSVERYAIPQIGRSIVSEINKHDIEKVLEPIWTTKPVMGKKLQQRMERILGFATAKEFRTGNNPAAWRDNLDQTLPDPSKIHETESFRALSTDEAPEFIAALQTREGSAARALEFCILTAARSVEIRGAAWSEIDLKRQRWTIPAERMKTRKEHTVPLPGAAVALLEKMPKHSELIFPAPRGGQLSDMSLLAVIKRMGWKNRTTVHGFRSTFKVFADEETDVQDFISEMALAHLVSDETKKAYKRSTLIEKRRKLMQQWSQFLGY